MLAKNEGIRRGVKAAKRKYEASVTFIASLASPALVEKKVKISDILKGLIGVIIREPYPACFSAITYPLYDSFILDTKADTHVCNNRDRF